jgi:hypothetical protein
MPLLLLRRRVSWSSSGWTRGGKRPPTTHKAEGQKGPWHAQAFLFEDYAFGSSEKLTTLISGRVYISTRYYRESCWYDESVRRESSLANVHLPGHEVHGSLAFEFI